MSMATAAAAVVAGTAATAAYLDGKYHIRKDVRTIRTMWHAERVAQKVTLSGRYCLWYLFEEQVQRMPLEEQCIWSHDGCYTWQETYAKTNQYARYLLSQGVKPNSMVAIYLMNSPDFVFSMLAIWAVACGIPLINFNLSGDALVHCLRVSKARVLVVDGDEGCQKRIRDVRTRVEQELGMKIIILDSTTKKNIESLSTARLDDSVRDGMSPRAPMCLLYTSGSTGYPKACPFPVITGHFLGGHRLGNLGLKPGPNADRWYDCMPMYHGTGGTVAISCLLGGVTLCIGKRFSTSKFWQDIRDSKATAFVYVGETARYLLATPESPLDQEHQVKVMYGNGLRPDVWKRFQDRFRIPCVAEFFNSSEGVFALLNTCRGPYLQNAVGHHGVLFRWRLRDTYVPVDVDHETGELIRDHKTGLAKRKPYEEGGEILVKLESEAGWSGYFGNSDATAKKFERDVLQKGDIFYRTGDALRRTPDGRWYFLDRLGDTYRWKSENVSTAEVAEILGRFPGIQEAIVYGVQVPGHDGRAGCAAVLLSPSSLASPNPNFFAELLAYAQANMPGYAVPVFLRILSSARSMHNNKQEKGPLKKDEINLDSIYGSGVDADEAKKSGKDLVMWWPRGLSRVANGEIGADSYVLFERKDWAVVRNGGSGGRARL